MLNDTALPVTEQAVQALEALDLGAEIAPVVAEAARVLEQRRVAAIQSFFPLAPHTADVLAQLEFQSSPFSVTEFPERCIELAAAAVTHHPALGQALRSQPILWRIECGLAAGLGAGPSAATARVAALNAVLARLAAVYLAVDENDAPARLLAETLPALEGRLAAIVERHRAHTEAVAAKQRAVTEARQVQLQRGTVEALEALRRWFQSKPTAVFMFGPHGNAWGAEQTLDGLDFARVVLGGAVEGWQLEKAIAARRTVDPDYRWPSEDELLALADATPGSEAKPLSVFASAMQALGVR